MILTKTVLSDLSDEFFEAKFHAYVGLGNFIRTFFLKDPLLPKIIDELYSFGRSINREMIVVTSNHLVY